MLQHLVRRTKSTAATDIRRDTGVLLFDRERILTHRRPPDILQRTTSKAMNALDLIGSNDAVGKRRTLLELEDSVRVSTFAIRARDPAVVHYHATVERLSCANGLNSAEGRRS